MAGESHSLTLGRQIELRKGVSYKGEFLDRPGPRLLGLGTIKLGGGIMLDKAAPYGGPIREYQRASAGDLLLAVVGITPVGSVIGSPALIPFDAQGDFAFTHHVAKVRVRDGCDLDLRFLYYVFRDPAFHAYVWQMQSGSTVPEIAISDVLSYGIRLPSIEIQRAIAHILGTLDDKIELNRRMSETLEAMARALFKSWFVDFDPVRAKAEGRDTGLPKALSDLFPSAFVDSELGEIPEGWGVAALPELLEINPRCTLKKGEVAPYLDMAGMPTQGHAPDHAVPRAFGSGMRFQNGDTLVARITPCLENGKTALVDFLRDGEIGWGSTEYIVLRSKPPLPEQFGYCLARSERFREFAIQSMTGSSGRQRVPAESLGHFYLPSFPRQVAAAFGRAIRPWFARSSHAIQESRTLAGLRDTLLPKLISGELRVKDAERFLARVG